MAVAEQFSLRWNDFHSNLSSAFHELLEDEDLVDVTLAAEGQYVQAHKLILSVCSPYFKELFKMNPCEHPIVILKDVKHGELKHILQFMYKGEVNVRQADLTSFLHTAEMLQVKGLTVGREERQKTVTPPPVQSDNDSDKTLISNNDEQGKWDSNEDCTIDQSGHEDKSPLKRLLTNTTNRSVQSKKKNKLNTSTETDFSSINQNQDSPIEYVSDSDPYPDDGEVYPHHMLEEPMLTKDALMSHQEGYSCKSGGVKCPMCHRFFANRYNLKVHIRDKHDTLEGTLQCEICQKRMRNPSCLRVHMYHHRKQAALLATQLMEIQPGEAESPLTAMQPGIGGSSIKKTDRNPVSSSPNVDQNKFQTMVTGRDDENAMKQEMKRENQDLQTIPTL